MAESSHGSVREKQMKSHNLAFTVIALVLVAMSGCVPPTYIAAPLTTASVEARRAVAKAAKVQDADQPATQEAASAVPVAAKTAKSQ
jgi:hypothetical protein